MGNQFKNVAIVTCLKTLLFIFNVAFLSIGWLLFIVGLWPGLDLSKYIDFSQDFSGTAPHLLIGISLLIILIGTIAFSCIIKGQPVLLYIYGGLLTCIFVMNAGMSASIVCYKDTFAKGLYDELIKDLATYQATKSDLDFAQANLQCCGVANYTDWVKMSPQRVIPTSCCINPNHCVTANYSEVFQEGCYDVIMRYLETNMDVLIGIAITFALLPLSGTVISCSLAGYIKKSKYDSMA